MNTHKARAVLVGLGPIGIEVGKALAGRDGIELIGAADPAPDKAGKPLSRAARRRLPERRDPPERGRALRATRRLARGKSDVVAALHGIAPPRRPAADRGGDRRRLPHRVDVRGALVPGAAPPPDGPPDRPQGQGEGRRRPRDRRQPRARHGPPRPRRRVGLRAGRLGAGSRASSTPPSAADRCAPRSAPG